MILTDGVHVVSDKSFGELHKFAKLYGLPRRQFHNGRIPHYDLRKRKDAYLLAIIEIQPTRRVSTRELVCRAIRRNQ